MAHNKRYTKAAGNVDANKIYTLKDAIKLAKANATAKFDETIDVVLALNIDPKQSDQNVRGMITMPNGIGKTARVAVFAKGEKVKEAQAAGADFVGGDDLADKISGGFTDFDRVIATPDMMGVVGKLGKVLGPKGLMPNPKLGTVTMNVADAVKAAKSGQVEFKIEKAGLIHAGVAKASFTEAAIEENIKALIGAIYKAKPASVKSNYIKKMGLSSSMGPGLKIDTATLDAA